MFPKTITRSLILSRKPCCIGHVANSAVAAPKPGGICAIVPGARRVIGLSAVRDGGAGNDLLRTWPRGAFAVNRAQTLPGRLLEILALPLVVAGLALTIRSLRAGHAPVLANAAVPVAACMAGVILGLSVLYKRWKAAVCIGIFVAGGARTWAVFAGGSPQLRAATEMDLRQIVAVGPGLPSGDARFGALLRATFASSETDRAGQSAIEQNRAAILAFGIAVGHANMARLIGLKPDSALVQNGVAVTQGTTLNGREDWPRHFAVSAALAVLGHMVVSDAGGLMKEELDTLTRGSGFSFGDLD